MNPDRRRTLTTLGTLAGAGVGSVLLGRTRPAAAATPQPPPLPWPYLHLDPARVADRAYWAYFDGHCMFSVFAGIVGELADRQGYPFTSFPLELMKFGAGGVAGWGTLCGTLNGAAAAIYLTADDPNPLIDEVFWWYSNEVLPDFAPAESPAPIPTSVARSPLCHVSVARWCDASGLGAYSRERNERCARLAAATARFTAATLNRFTQGTFRTEHSAPESVRQCRACHERGGQVADMRGTMDCSGCHSGSSGEHPPPAEDRRQER